MAIIKPFKAIRPHEDLVERVAALPYDVYTSMEARDVIADNPYSFLNIDRPETAFPVGYDMYAPEVYEAGRNRLWKQFEEGVYIQDSTNNFYIYELTMDGRVQTGICALASIDDYLSGVILKHENTREEKELDRIKHVTVCEAQTGPIFLAYRRNYVIEQVVADTKKDHPIYDFTSEDGIRHRVFLIQDAKNVQTISNAFLDIDRIYIADGHHRCASAVKVGVNNRQKNPGKELESDYFLSVLFPENELKIMDYNRVIKDLNGHKPDEFINMLGESFEVSKVDVAVKPDEKGCFGMYLKGQWYKLSYKGQYSNDPVESLDVSVLQKEVLEKLLGIEDPRTDHRIDFVGGIRGLDELERRCNVDCVVAFSMYPTTITELFAVADEGKLMPPKSTWFEPKLRSGLFIHSIR